MSTLCLITARGGSKGIPNKNIKPLAGKPLIAWSVEQAKQSGICDRVVISTDSPDIAAIGKQYGAEAPFLRPAEMSTDTAPHILSVLHALTWLREIERWKPDIVILLQPTSPLRTPEDIRRACERLCSTNAPAVIGVCEAESHPYLVQRLSPDGVLENFINHGIAYPRRQDLPAAYRPNGAIYVNRSELLIRDQTLFPPGTLGYIMPAERSIDIDTQLDFNLAAILLMNPADEVSK
jgi:CMP-N-acetylneuraminic acid synthetase